VLHDPVHIANGANFSSIWAFLQTWAITLHREISIAILAAVFGFAGDLTGSVLGRSPTGREASRPIRPLHPFAVIGDDVEQHRLWDGVKRACVVRLARRLARGQRHSNAIVVGRVLVVGDVQTLVFLVRHSDETLFVHLPPRSLHICILTNPEL